MAGAESISRDGVLEDARAASRVLIARARELAQLDPGAFELLKENLSFQLDGIRMSSGLAGERNGGREVSLPQSDEALPIGAGRGDRTKSKPLTWNKVRKSLGVEYLILKCLARSNGAPIIVDQIVDFVSRVFPVDAKGGRASLISKISRLRNDKGCLDQDDSLKGVSYKISEGGRDYLRKLESVYLTKPEITHIKGCLKEVDTEA